MRWVIISLLEQWADMPAVRPRPELTGIAKTAKAKKAARAEAPPQVQIPALPDSQAGPDVENVF